MKTSVQPRSRILDWLAHRNDPLADHLDEVSRLAAGFAEAFHAADWGRAAGLLHDLGKACEAFQKRLDGDEGMVDHAIGGAAEAIARFGPLGRLLAYAVAGHHGGLPDPGRLDERLAARPTYDPAAVPDLPALALPPQDLSGFGGSMFVRMVFSCLTDADFLATERVLRPEAAERGIPFDAAGLLTRLRTKLDELMAGADPTPVNARRREVLARCLEMAGHKPGFFSLSVPTGGGKTLAALAFALAHAQRWSKRRVAVVIPYTSIIEQTAQVYRDALGRDSVLEHHSRFRHAAESQPLDPSDRMKLELAEENWDAPVVVTTAVQFFESLFAHRPGRCRKLHNLAGAVVVLDEAQLMPMHLLAPCLQALRTLVESYGCTVVLSTATLPALADARWMGKHALPQVTEIVADRDTLHASLRRVRYDWAGEMEDEAVAARLLAAGQGMAVVNTRGHARDLFELIRNEPGAVHLSALMTPAHRSRTIGKIRAALDRGEPCRVVATQLVECGVDLDFPVVLRALAGLDSIIQAGGRCNRSGLLAEAVVTVFDPAGRPSPWPQPANLARKVLEEFADPSSPQAIERFFQLLYRGDLDPRKILDKLTPKGSPDYAFRSAAEAFRFIEDGQMDVTVPHEPEAEALLARLERDGHSPALLRALQPYTVHIRPRHLETLPLRLVADRVRVLDLEAYDPVTGVRV